jgi:hypothetical protein
MINGDYHYDTCIFLFTMPPFYNNEHFLRYAQTLIYTYVNISMLMNHEYFLYFSNFTTHIIINMT